MMRHLKFTWEDFGERCKTLITSGSAFQFDMTDIARIRKEIELLIDNLSKPYLDMKNQEKAKKRAKRKQIESSKIDKENASSEIASEEANPRKEDGKSSRTASDASDENDGTAERSIAEAVGGGTETSGDATVPSSEE